MIPIDFGLILVTGSILCASHLFRPGIGMLRYLWLVPASILFGALAIDSVTRRASFAYFCCARCGFVLSRQQVCSSAVAGITNGGSRILQPND